MRRGDGTQSQERREILRSQERKLADTRPEIEKGGKTNQRRENEEQRGKEERNLQWQQNEKLKGTKKI